MANRVTATEVKQIIDTSLSDTVIEAYIAAANPVVTEVLGSDTTITDALRKEIERWLTAHLIASTQERQAKEEGAGGAYIKYQGITGKGLESTLYGQQVLALDSTGKMRGKLTGKAASITAVPSFD